MKTHPVADLSHLEETGFDSRVVTWWGTLGYMALEGMAFVLCYGIFLYVAWLSPEWPLGFPPQPLFWTTVFTVVMIVSLVPNFIIMRYTHRKDNGTLRWLLVLMSLIGLGLLVVRWLEFGALTLRWDDNAYGSMLWAFLGLHTLHLATDVVDTIVMTALFFTKHVPEKRFTDADENALYWAFVVVTWLPFYALLYWAPRLGGAT
jgi:cytochrome c oxidase subunit III